MSQVIERQILALKEILSGRPQRRVLLTVHQQMTTRIFDEGKDAKNSRIGVYSDAYLKQRKKKGLGSSKKVVLEFTGQMRNDYQLIEKGGKFGSGFLNNFNGQKSEWVEDTYDKSIFDLTSEEERLLTDLLNEETQRILEQAN